MSSEVDPARDDRVLLKRRANHAEGRTARGGRLFATNKRIVFRPHLIERALSRAKTVVIPWSEVEEITVAPRAVASAAAGALRERLEVKRRDGSSEFFVVNNVNELLRELREIQGAVATAA
jgi:hypothetical protein